MHFIVLLPKIVGSYSGSCFSKVKSLVAKSVLRSLARVLCRLLGRLLSTTAVAEVLCRVRKVATQCTQNALQAAAREMRIEDTWREDPAQPFLESQPESTERKVIRNNLIGAFCPA